MSWGLVRRSGDTIYGFFGGSGRGSSDVIE